MDVVNSGIRNHTSPYCMSYVYIKHVPGQSRFPVTRLSGMGGGGGKGIDQLVILWPLVLRTSLGAKLSLTVANVCAVAYPHPFVSVCLVVLARRLLVLVSSLRVRAYVLPFLERKFSTGEAGTDWNENTHTKKTLTKKKEEIEEEEEEIEDK